MDYLTSYREYLEIMVGLAIGMKEWEEVVIK